MVIKLDTDLENGLTEAQVYDILERDGQNVLTPQPVSLKIPYQEKIAFSHKHKVFLTGRAKFGTFCGYKYRQKLKDLEKINRRIDLYTLIILINAPFIKISFKNEYFLRSKLLFSRIHVQR